MHLMMERRELSTFHESFAVQLNDTHPAIAVAELMRLLVDEHDLDWEQAWQITTKTFAYTNHTLLPEALEKWSVELFGRLLPRHLEIIYEINRRFLEEVQALYPGDDERLARMSIIEESGDRYVRMAHLACVGSHAINGVAALHTEFLKEHVLHDFYGMWPERFSNKTNGVTPRRWMALANPGLTRLVTSSIGENWLKDLDELRKLEMFIDDGQFRKQWRQVKLDAKKRLASIIKERTAITVTPGTLFDVQVKRLHEYKRQHLKVLYIITLYHRIKDNPDTERFSPHLHFWRQGRARLFHGQAYHQTHQFGGRGGQQRSGGP